jgi:hypothetical protein
MSCLSFKKIIIVNKNILSKTPRIVLATSKKNLNIYVPFKRSIQVYSYHTFYV